jgi:hypothetical protein
MFPNCTTSKVQNKAIYNNFITGTLAQEILILNCVKNLIYMAFAVRSQAARDRFFPWSLWSLLLLNLFWVVSSLGIIFFLLLSFILQQQQMKSLASKWDNLKVGILPPSRVLCKWRVVCAECQVAGSVAGLIS